MKNKTLLILAMALSLYCKAQYFIPTDPAERLKTYQQYLKQVKDFVKKDGHDNIVLANQSIGYLKALEPDSSEPYKLQTICSIALSEFKTVCKNASTYLKMNPGSRDTLVLKFRAVAYINMLNATRDTLYYDSAMNDCNELITKYNMTKFYIWLATLNNAYAAAWNETNLIPNKPINYRDIRGREYEVMRDSDLVVYKRMYGENDYFKQHYPANLMQPQPRYSGYK